MLFALLLAPGFARAAQTCPWLNAATAGGLLGVPVTATFELRSGIETCMFARTGADLRIEVLTIGSADRFASFAAACGANPEPLKAIGNEAVICSLADGRSARVVGRVRDRIFSILIHSADAAPAANGLREKARIAAEHVAGNLF